MRNENEGTIFKQVKIGPMTVDCMFIEYATNSKVCWFMVNKSEPPDSYVKGLNNLGKNQKRMNLVRRFRGVVKVKDKLLPPGFIL